MHRCVMIGRPPCLLGFWWWVKINTGAMKLVVNALGEGNRADKGMSEAGDRRISPPISVRVMMTGHLVGG
ncbi:hypothetical protein Lysil_1504 [Lysobacter silvestris]|uniref:Uncharacterized protein n=1 Tax=Solilutibacter silvestris TaxID=1645665 RepID=A0A2K1PX11_9GAMM|nr:hypothetical protein Lysil_1504 [Lysobacter silvestris]